MILRWSFVGLVELETVLVLQKRQNDFGMFMEITEYGGGRRCSYVIIWEGCEGSGWERCISQLRRLVKHVEQTGIVGPKTAPTSGKPWEVERGRRTFAEVVAGKGQTKEKETMSKGGMEKIDQKPGKAIVDSRKHEAIFAPVDPIDQAGLILAKTIMEDNT